jgi:hypothetical protein
MSDFNLLGIIVIITIKSQMIKENNNQHTKLYK